jgi:predicted transcriptional regulator
MLRKVEQGKKMSSLRDNKIKNLSFPGVLKSISDDKSLSIFQLIADVNSNGEIILKKLGLTRKQYYSKISTMMKAGLIKRQSRKYRLTHCCTTIAKKSSRQLL